MRTTAIQLICALLLWAPAAAAGTDTSPTDSRSAGTPEFTETDLEFFESRIRPLLINKCGDCHGADAQENDLRLDSWAGIIQGGKGGPLIRPGDPEGSLLIVAVSYRDNDLRMPPDGRLSKQEVADLKRWIGSGAAHPDRLTAAGRIEPRRTNRIDFDAAREFWSLRPVVRPSVPVAGTNRAQTPIDRFLLEKLAERGLRMSPPADRATLIRRMTFDLTGLPPTPEEVDRFVADTSPDAVDRLIDRLLASPDYGQRWGRFWLDVARYADSNGLDENIAHGNAWRYRDYVIAAFNSDMPYDRFLTEQIAGDLLPVDEDDTATRNRRLIATGYLALGPKVLAEPDAAKMEMDIIDEQLDSIGKGLLGLTFGCARCHDHKFDPISMRDYYALAGVFKSTRVMENFTKVARWHENPVPSPSDLERKSQHDALVAAQKQRIETIIADARDALLAETPECAPSLEAEELEKRFPEATRKKLKEARERLKKLQAENADLIPTAMGAQEAEVRNVAIHLRGSHLTLGDIVPRRIPEVFQSGELREFSAQQSGRLELARWLTSPENPLTSRVMVNRIWRWHFGTGIVASTDNFGVLGERPSHPRLLDWLAAEFISSGWSIHHLHRLILRSDAYRQASAVAPDAPGQTFDPENRLLWHFPVRRLEAEAVRDSILAVSGQLDRRMGGSMMAVRNREWVFNHLSVDPTRYDTTRRSVYLPVIRNNLYDVFQLFDYSDASAVSGHRTSSTVAPQALFMLNSDLVLDAAERLGRQTLAQREASRSDRIDWLYRQVLGRAPTDRERTRFQAYLSDRPPGQDADLPRLWASLAHVLIASNEFLFVR